MRAQGIEEKQEEEKDRVAEAARQEKAGGVASSAREPAVADAAAALSAPQLEATQRPKISCIAPFPAALRRQRLLQQQMGNHKL